MGDKELNLNFDNLFFNKLSKAFTKKRGDKEFFNRVNALLELYQTYFSELGLIGGGFLFLDVWKNEYQFFADTILEEGSYGNSFITPYIWYDKDAQKRYEKLIHALFIYTREKQEARNNSSSKISGEFIFYLNNSSTDTTSNALPFYEERIHYVSTGETLLTIISWFLLKTADSINKDLSKIEGDDYLSLFQITWLGEVVIQQKKVAYRKDDLNTDTDFFELKFIDAVKELSEEAGGLSWFGFLKKLGILNEDESQHQERLDLILNSANQLSPGNDWTLPSPLTNANISEFLKKLSEAYIQKITGFAKGEHLDVRAFEFETKAKLPILPYFFWNCLDTGIITYLAFPIWRSPTHYAVSEDWSGKAASIDSNIMGYCLSAVKPISYLENDSQQEALERFRRLIQVLKFIAAPLVELCFYDTLEREVLTRRKKELLAGIMARNLSHNVGSHILGNENLYHALGIKNSGNNLVRYRLAEFHSYLQGRLDFIARVLSETPHKGGNLFFIKDVLLGFIQKWAIINTIAADNGFPGHRILFSVKLSLSDIKESIVFHYDDDGVLHPRDPAYNDILVSVPAGMTGRHALYAFLENYIRNSVKYGTKSKELNQLEIYLELKDYDENNLVLIMHDNASIDSDSENAKKIDFQLKEGLLDSKGELTSSGHGLIEMGKCAEFLKGRTKKDVASKSENRFHDGIKCIDVVNGTDHSITYQLLINRALLMNVYSDKLIANEYSNFKIRNINQFITSSLTVDASAFLNIVLLDDNSYNKIFVETNCNLTKLPFRTVFLSKNYYEIPEHLVYIQNATLYSDCFSDIKDKVEEIFLKIYSRFVFHNISSTDVLTTLKFVQEPHKGWKAIQLLSEDIIGKIEIVTQTSKETRIKDVYKNFATRSYKKNIIYAHHGMIVKEEARDSNSLFYHKMNGEQEYDILQTLQTPPNSQVNLAGFVLSLIESSLLKLLIIDERISNYLCPLGQFSEEKTRKLQDIGIFATHSITVNKHRFELSKYAMGKEGVNLDNGRLEINLLDNNRQPIIFKQKFDVIILHKGVIDQIMKQNEEGGIELVQRLSDSCRVLIWTSGRGLEVNKKGNERLLNISNRFIDFNEIEYYTTTSLNKYQLGRAIIQKCN